MEKGELAFKEHKLRGLIVIVEDDGEEIVVE